MLKNIIYKSIKIATISCFFIYSSYSTSSQNHLGLVYNYNNFKDIKESEYIYVDSHIKKDIYNFDNDLYYDIKNKNDLIYKKFNLSNMRNNSFTIHSFNKKNGKTVAVSFLRKYNTDLGGCILFFDYDECLSLKEKDYNIYENINIKYDTKSSSYDIYKFIDEHEISHTDEYLSIFGDFKQLLHYNINNRNYSAFKSHYIEVYADLNALLNISASNNLINDVYKIRKHSYFLNADTMHYSSPYIIELLNFDYDNHNISNNRIIINNIFKKVFNLKYLRYSKYEVDDVLDDMIEISKITSNSKIKSIKKASDYIDFKKEY